MAQVAQAMQAVKRQDFLPDTMKVYADQDRPLHIGYSQANSQPSTVRRMLEWLDVRKSQRILDVGSGSGWTSALLARLTGKAGEVYAVELVPELVKFGRENCERLSVPNVTFTQAAKTYGLPNHAPYNRILVSAGADELPDELVRQLGAPGKLVIPIGSTIWEIAKDANGELHETPHDGFIFVPLLPPQE